MLIEFVLFFIYGVLAGYRKCTRYEPVKNP